MRRRRFPSNHEKLPFERETISANSKDNAYADVYACSHKWVAMGRYTATKWQFSLFHDFSSVW